MHHTENPTPEDPDVEVTMAYEGVPLRQRGDMMNLTDMWRAAGGVLARGPYEWLRLEGTKRFRVHQRENMMVAAAKESITGIARDKVPAPDGLVVVERGQNGNTWAHWQLSLAYAQYLSPAFHAWCNAVIRNAMETGRAPRQERDALMRYIERQFRVLHRKLDRLDRHAADQMFLQLSGQEVLLGTRREFSSRSRALMCELIATEEYEQQCPCCFAVPVVGPDGRAVEGAEYDHFYHRAMNRPDHGWLICRSCHHEVTHGGYLARFGRMEEFRRFQTSIIEQIRRTERAKGGLPPFSPPPPRRA